MKRSFEESESKITRMSQAVGYPSDQLWYVMHTLVWNQQQPQSCRCLTPAIDRPSWTRLTPANILKPAVPLFLRILIYLGELVAGGCRCAGVGWIYFEMSVPGWVGAQWWAGVGYLFWTVSSRMAGPVQLSKQAVTFIHDLWFFCFDQQKIIVKTNLSFS